ncbi:Coiled-coil domain-containing protein 81 [Holothuria leucospilota]|uniref:Coiled-coil domain-containing protein 81 n=1 Tax=Holothuria leucospilota TaxID=206669 RepID=A0A9Q0YQR4_HOLLE|nr:Coiled-coil domain-containing protein 81 [Holothuria leucospilota]
MTDALQEFVAEAKKNKYSAIPKLSEDDIVSVWDNVAGFVERHMALQKGVNIPGIGTFTFSQKKLDIGNNKFMLIQRPVFVLSEKFAQTHALENPKHFTPGQIPIVQLNFSALSSESPFDRDTVEGCVKEVLQAFSRAVQARRNVEFVFSGIGKLLIRDGKVKMKFFKDFINMMDGSGQLSEALRNRPDTTDSVISRASSVRPGTSNTLILPRITQGAGKDSLGLESENKESKEVMPSIQEEGDTSHEGEEGGEEEQGEDKELQFQNEEEQLDHLESGEPARSTIPTAVGISLEDGLVASSPPRGIRGSALNPSPPNSKPPSPSGELPPPKPPAGLKPPTPPHITQKRSPLRPPSGSSCGHGAGQELCYLCHQRAVNNVPVSFEAERKKKEQEQDRLLQQYQHMKDTESIIREQAQNLSNRHHSQKIAAFNLGVSEAVNSKKKQRPTSFHRSYIFHNRPFTPPKLFMQDEYASYLAEQVEAKQASKSKQKSEKDFLERLEQVQLAEELAAQREQYLRDKAAQTDMYQKALSAQIQIRDMINQSLDAEDKRMEKFNHHGNPVTNGSLTHRKGTPHPGRHLDPLTLPVPKIILPFSESEPVRFKTSDQRMVRFKPLPLPAAVPDSKEPIFGKYDATNEQLAEKRRRAIKVYQEQLKAVDQAEKMKLLKHLKQQREETDMLERTRQELIADRAARFEQSVGTRKSLEECWKEAATVKKSKEDEQRLCVQSPGVLLHEQCDQYHRCGQCQRRLTNCGESNIWSESRYISGSQLIV